MLIAIVAIAWLSALGDNPGDIKVQSEQSSPTNQADGDKPPIIARPFDPTEDTYAQWIMATFSVLATVASVWAVLLLRETLRETRAATANTAKAVEQAAESNRITNSAVTNDLRPWLSLDGLEIRHVEVRDGRFRVLAKAMVKNVGKSPAVDVRLSVGFYRLGMNVRHVRSLDDFCEACGVSPEPGGRNRILFPSSEPEEFRRNTDNDLIRTEIPNVVGVRVLACITYRSKISGDTVFHTGTVMVATTKPPRFIGGRDEVIQGDDLEVMVSGEYNTMT